MLKIAICLLFVVLWQMPVTAEEGMHHTLRYLNEYSSKKIRTIRFSPDSNQLAVSVGDKVDFIDPTSGRITGQYKLSPFSMSYSRDGNSIYMISEYRDALLDTLTAAALTPQRNVIPGFTGIAVETQSGKLLIERIDAGSAASEVEDLAVGDELIAVGQGRNGNIVKITGSQVKNVLPLLNGPADSYLQIRVLPRGTFDEESAKVHLLRRYAKKQVGDTFQFIKPVAAEINEQLAWCMSGNRHEFRDAKTGATVARLETIDIGNVGRYAISPDQKKFAVVSSQKSDKSANALEVFDIATQDRLAFIPMVVDSYCDLQFAPDNNRVLVGTWGTVEVCDTKQNKLIGRLTLGWTPPVKKRKKDRSGETPAASLFVGADDAGFANPDRKRSPKRLVSRMAASSKDILAIADAGGLIKLWDINTGAMLKEMPKNPKEETNEILFSPNGKWLAYYIKGVLHIVDVSAVEPSTAEQIALMEKEEEKNNVPATNDSDQAEKLGVGSKVEVRSRGQWYAAEITKKDGGGRWIIHYEDSPKNWDEIVTEQRIRQLDASKD